MARWTGQCRFCGQIWKIEGESVRQENIAVMNCQLCGKQMQIVRDEPLGLIQVPMKFGDLSKNVRLITELTERKWPMWFENFSKNIPTIVAGRDMNEIEKRKGPAIVVGAGPSIWKNGQLKLLAEHRPPTVISTDRMLRPLIEAGITPDFVTTVDGDQKVSDFYKFPQKLKVKAVLDAATIHPDTVKAAQESMEEIYWFVHFLDNPMQERCDVCRRLSMTAAFHYMSGRKVMTQASGNAGAFGWHLASFLECEPVILVGMDYGYLGDEPIEKTMYYSSYLALCENNPEQAKTCYEKRKNPYFNNEYITDLVWETYRKVFVDFLKSAKTTTVNATGGGALHEAPIINMSLEDALSKYVPVTP